MAKLTEAQVDEVTSYASWLSEDVEHLDQKSWLAPALASHTARATGLPQPEVLSVLMDFFWGCKHPVEVMMQPDVDCKTGMWTCLSCGNRRTKP